MKKQLGEALPAIEIVDVRVFDDGMTTGNETQVQTADVYTGGDLRVISVTLGVVSVFFAGAAAANQSTGDALSEARTPAMWQETADALRSSAVEAHQTAAYDGIAAIVFGLGAVGVHWFTRRRNHTTATGK